MGTYGLSCIGNNHEQIRIDPRELEPHVPIPRPISRRDDRNEIDFGITPISFCTSSCGIDIYVHAKVVYVVKSCA